MLHGIAPRTLQGEDGLSSANAVAPVTAQRKQTSLKEGDVLAGRYRIERVIAMGGMGVVVAARHVQLGQRVALKVLHENTVSPQTTARFLSEAKASAQLRSDHVVRVSDVGQLDSGEPFMVMELLEGADLAQVLENEGPMPVSQAVEYVLQACEGIAEAHAARIVHRDLKPENLFRTLRANGAPLIKVLDFGVSKALSQDVRAEGTVTTTDAVFGSPLYMSPEQMQSATKADERSDIWSIGVVLYELISGRMPFDAESMAGLAVVVATEPPRHLQDDAPSAPIELEAVIDKCLQKRPEHRYPNVAELAADLEPFAPHARQHVENIQRLLQGGTMPSRSIPAAPASNRLIAMGAETLGPLDSAMSGSFRAPKRKPWVPFLIAGAAFAVVSTLGIVLLRGTGPEAVSHAPSSGVSGKAPLTVPTDSAPPVPPPVATVAATVTATPTMLVKPLGTHATPSAKSAMPVVASAPVAPTASVITGISRDRK